jgi:hypothetical protein
MRVDLVFTHEPGAWGEFKGAFNWLTYRGRTVATLLDDSGHVVASATAHCSVLDQYNRRTGARAALGKLMAELGLAKDKRTALWRAWRTGHCKDVQL